MVGHCQTSRCLIFHEQNCLSSLGENGQSVLLIADFVSVNEISGDGMLKGLKRSWGSHPLDTLIQCYAILPKEREKTWDFPGTEPLAGFVLPEVNFPLS